MTIQEYIPIIMEHTENAYEGIKCRITISQAPQVETETEAGKEENEAREEAREEVSFNVISFNGAVMVEIEKGVWYLTGNKVFSKAEDFNTIMCFIEMSAGTEHLEKAKILLNEDTKTFLDLVSSIKETTKDRIQDDSIQEIEFTLKKAKYQITSIRKTRISLSENEEAYESQIKEWKRGFLRLNTPDFLYRRIKELEAENARLNNIIKQAERT